jgi:SAM-dependent methyltransferase
MKKLKYIIKKNIPLFLLFFFQKIILLKRIISLPQRSFFCIFCQKKNRGYYTGYPPYDLELTCGNCFSVGRNRLLGEYLKNLDLRNYEILHFAPEKCVVNLIETKLFKNYKKVDLFPDFDQERCDIENISFKHELFDLIICSHVLEHVNYNKAIANLKKIVKKDGVILLMFPIIENWKETYSDASIISFQDRELHFGQFDHIHVFGRDILNSFKDEFEISEKISFGKNGILNGIRHGETLFIIKKI